MIFALLDYYRYVRRSGRFARDFRKSVMGGAFQGDFPSKSVALMKPGDFFLVQTLNSSVSWLVMYLTSSEVSHVAMYAGNSKIIHATFDGVVMESAESLFTPHARVLPATLELSEQVRMDIPQSNEKMLGHSYGWGLVFRKGLMILTARDWGYFRWKFVADLAFLILALDLSFILTLGIPVLSWLLPIYLAIICLNGLLSFVKPLKFSAATGKPCDMLTVVQRSGGTLMFDAYNIAKQQSYKTDSSAGKNGPTAP